MSDQSAYDVAIVGAGPAGLSAARTLARLGFHTVVVERQPAPGRLDHPQAALLAPVPGLVRCELRSDGPYYPDLDLHVPNDLVVGQPMLQQYVGPDGNALVVRLGKAASAPAITVDKPSFLDYLADQAAAAGAELEFGRAATGLLRSGRKICGLATPRGDILADLVLSAEGVARHLAVEAGLYGAGSTGTRHIVTLTQEMAVADCQNETHGQITTFGRRYSSAGRGYGTVTLGAPGRLSVSYTIFSDHPAHHTDPALWSYLDEYVRSDGRIHGLLAGGRILQRTGHRRTAGSMPDQVVRDGFLAVGDAVLGGEHTGILPALYLGRAAALAAAEALENGEPSSAALLPFDRFFRSKVLAGLQVESRALWELTGMTDEEINRLFALLVRVHRSTQFFSTWETGVWVAARWLVHQTQYVGEDLDLLRRFCMGSTAVPPVDAPSVLALRQPRRVSVAPY